jgi:hypothetical protein
MIYTALRHGWRSWRRRAGGNHMMSADTHPRTLASFVGSDRKARS